MEVIREWAFSLCCCMVAGSLIYMLTPSKNLAKVFKITLSLFMLCCIITPFAFGNLRFDDVLTDELEQKTQDHASDLNETINGQLIKTVTDTIESHIESILKSFGIEQSKININMNVDDKSGIVINQIELTLPDAFLSQDQAISRQIEKDLGKKPEITYVKEVY
ncbi:stage III sporulation protein AF [Zongyangia hominis]|uniref:Stage III sporulation protein AF n=1 Tax=Zongyangia hominis TaxID=2763677 RepID=A0A926EAU1_9FIRM|nr:stage III sporulation protein AF [Zongyangia hominis]MBC8569605.1 stage III sporulation protein AF [Zongyangia hominis]